MKLVQSRVESNFRQFDAKSIVDITYLYQFHRLDGTALLTRVEEEITRFSCAEIIELLEVQSKLNWSHPRLLGHGLSHVKENPNSEGIQFRQMRKLRKICDRCNHIQCPFFSSLIKPLLFFFSILLYFLLFSNNLFAPLIMHRLVACLLSSQSRAFVSRNVERYGIAVSEQFEIVYGKKSG